MGFWRLLQICVFYWERKWNICGLYEGLVVPCCFVNILAVERKIDECKENDYWDLDIIIESDIKDHSIHKIRFMIKPADKFSIP